MNKQQKKNNGMMRIIVTICIGFLLLTHTAAFVLKSYGIDTEGILKLTDVVFCTELGMTLLKKLISKNKTDAGASDEQE